MKKTIFFLLTAICNTLAAQTIIIRDQSSREPIPGALLKAGEKMLITDQKGAVDIKPFIGTEFSVNHPSYQSATFNFRSAAEVIKEIGLTSKIIQLDEIVLSANRHEEKKIDVPYSIEVLTQKNIEFMNQPTTAEVLQNTGAVFVQKSQMGGGSPVLRGFEANKILLVVDGVRMNNAIYRGGHLQDVISLDANMLERTEVIFGPSSTIYGSDALGGVLHFYTKAPVFADSGRVLVKTNTVVRYSSANNERTGHLDVNLGWKKFASMTNITYSDFGDLRSGAIKTRQEQNRWDRNFYADRINNRDTMLSHSDKDLQRGTAYGQMDLMQRFALRAGKDNSHHVNLQYSRSTDIPRYDRLSEIRNGQPRFAEWHYGPQKRLLAAYSFINSRKTRLTDELRVIGAYQRIDQDRITRGFGNSIRQSQREDVMVQSVNLDAFKEIKHTHELRYGLELQNNDVRSTAEDLDIVTNIVRPAQTRYADGGNNMILFGLYLSHSWELNRNLVFTNGLRFSTNRLYCQFRDTTFIKFPFKDVRQESMALTGNLGLTWKNDNNFKLSVLLNTGYRAPNVDDLSRVFESTGNILIVPNAGLKPEYASNLEINFSKVFVSKLKLDVTAFYTILDNALVVSDYKFNGQDSMLFNGEYRRIQASQNKNSAFVYGYTAGFSLEFSSSLSIRSTINYTYGRYQDNISDTVVPMDHIPPLFGQTSLFFRKKNTDAEFFARYNGPKRSGDYSPSGEDNALYSADPVNGFMPGWFTLNVRAGYNLTKQFRINLACENILDHRYRQFASGISAPGRNFIISIRYKM